MQFSSLSQTAGCRGTAVVPRASDHHEGPRKLNAAQTERSNWLEIKAICENKVTRLMAITYLCILHSHITTLLKYLVLLLQ